MRSGERPVGRSGRPSAIVPGGGLRFGTGLVHKVRTALFAECLDPLGELATARGFDRPQTLQRELRLEALGERAHHQALHPSIGERRTLGQFARSFPSPANEVRGRSPRGPARDPERALRDPRVRKEEFLGEADPEEVGQEVGQSAVGNRPERRECRDAAWRSPTRPASLRRGPGIIRPRQPRPEAKRGRAFAFRRSRGPIALARR